VIESWEKKYEKIPSGAWVIMFTGIVNVIKSFRTRPVLLPSGGVL
jgi:hypothetical protein